jgi:hypothetical protein
VAEHGQGLRAAAVKAVLLRNRRSHWVYDAHVTYCGRMLVDLPVEREVSCEQLPGDPCPSCERIAEGTPEHVAAHRVTLPPSTGSLRTTGPLTHGTRPRTGRRL